MKQTITDALRSLRLHVAGALAWSAASARAAVPWLRSMVRAAPMFLARTAALLLVCVGVLYLYELYTANFAKEAKNFWWQYPRELTLPPNGTRS